MNVQIQIETKVMYVPDQSNPEQQQYFFAYKIKIKNNGTEGAQLIHRHWVIQNAFGSIDEVRGPGVVGKQPHIKAGADFEYDSFCPMNTSTGIMKGTFQFRNSENGKTFDVEIPEFYLIAPQSLH